MRRNTLSTGEPAGADSSAVHRVGSLAFHSTAVEASDLRKGFDGEVSGDSGSLGLA